METKIARAHFINNEHYDLAEITYIGPLRIEGSWSTGISASCAIIFSGELREVTTYLDIPYCTEFANTRTVRVWSWKSFKHVEIEEEFTDRVYTERADVIASEAYKKVEEEHNAFTKAWSDYKNNIGEEECH